jgi:hypothetical protein
VLLTEGLFADVETTCLIARAFRHGSRVLPVVVTGGGFQFELYNAHFFASMGESLDGRERALIRSHGLTPAEVSRALERLLKVIALPFTPHASAGVLNSQVRAIIEALQPSDELDFTLARWPPWRVYERIASAQWSPWRERKGGGGGGGGGANCGRGQNGDGAGDSDGAASVRAMRPAAADGQRRELPPLMRLEYKMVPSRPMHAHQTSMRRSTVPSRAISDERLAVLGRTVKAIVRSRELSSSTGLTAAATAGPAAESPREWEHERDLEASVAPARLAGGGDGDEDEVERMLAALALSRDTLGSVVVDVRGGAPARSERADSLGRALARACTPRGRES